MSIHIVQKIVVLGTGGTIAGLSRKPSDNIAYVSGQLGINQLLDALPGLASTLAGRLLVTEQVAQIDSKDMSFVVWQQLALRAAHHLAQADVTGLVISHGTDTLEETAYFLHAVLPALLLTSKPVVLTCAMRPASALTPDGPQNLMDAMAVAMTPGACGVVVVCAGTIHGAVAVQKVHPYRLDAFDSGDTGPLGYVEEGVVWWLTHGPLTHKPFDLATTHFLADVIGWPRVEIVMNYAGTSGAIVDALIVQSSDSNSVPVRGLVVAATGNGTLHHDLEAALIRAQATGIKVIVATRCANGHILPKPDNVFPDSRGLSPVKARVALMLSLLSAK
jgi:L-asparaginase